MTNLRSEISTLNFYKQKYKNKAKYRIFYDLFPHAAQKNRSVMMRFSKRLVLLVSVVRQSKNYSCLLQHTAVSTIHFCILCDFHMI